MPARAAEADQAGGEVIFSSDGLDPLPVVQPPQLRLQQSPPSSSADELHVDNVSAEQAFEVFAGKLYSVTLPGNSSLAKVDRKETALERLARLKREVEELECDASAGEFLTDELQNISRKIKSMKLTGQEQWTAQLQAALVESQKPLEGSSSSSSLNQVTSTGHEERLRRLEQVVGAPLSKGSRSGQTVSERLQALESFRSKLSPKEVEALHKKAKVIRQDLEAAAKARSKLLSSSGSQDSKTITELYDAFKSLQGMSGQLPALASRLQVLAHQHADAATWAARCQATEETAGRLESQMSKLEAAIQNLETGMKENASLMQENIAALDEKLKKVTGN